MQTQTREKSGEAKEEGVPSTLRRKKREKQSGLFAHVVQSATAAANTPIRGNQKNESEHQCALVDAIEYTHTEKKVDE